MKLTTSLFAFSVVLAGIPQTSKALPPLALYTVTDLGIVNGATSSSAYGVNDLGHVTGESGSHVFLWTPQTGMQDLGAVLGHEYSVGVAINNNDQIAANGTNASPFNRRGVRATTSTMQNPGTLGGDYSEFFGIDATGRLAGGSSTATFETHAVRSTTGTALVDIGTLGGTFSGGLGMNASGQIVGHSTTAQGQYHAYFWPGSGSLQDLSTLGGTQSMANDISDSGIIVGDSSTTGNAAYHAFIYRNGQMTDLGSLGIGSSYGYAVNDLGQVIGTYSDGTYGYPYIWDSNSGMRELNSLLDPVTGAGWTLFEADDINNSGQIVGNGYHNGVLRAYLLTPIPEPSTIMLCATLVGLIPLRTRQHTR